MAAMLLAAEMGNWQRGGGKGARPQPVERPKETRGAPTTLDELARRKKVFNDELEHRRRRKEGC